jgi:hypothetical protein
MTAVDFALGLSLAKYDADQINEPLAHNVCNE